MTGFGKAHGRFQQTDVSVEIRSVNNRFQEVSVKLPKLYQIYEFDCRLHVQKRIRRGKLTLTIQITDQDAAAERLTLDSRRVQKYLSLVDTLKQSAGLDEPTRLDHLLSFGDIISADDEMNVDPEFKTFLFEQIDAAVTDLNLMRGREGAALVNDLNQRNSHIREMITTIEQSNSETVQGEFEKLKQRVSQLLADTSMNPERLETEIAILADRSDVTEECVRLRSHTDQFAVELKKQASGKSLNFLLQEMHREVNTIGSKTPRAEVSHMIVKAKEEIEKMREQVQNLE